MVNIPFNIKGEEQVYSTSSPGQKTLTPGWQVPFRGLPGNPHPFPRNKPYMYKCVLISDMPISKKGRTLFLLQIYMNV